MFTFELFTQSHFWRFYGGVRPLNDKHTLIYSRCTEIIPITTSGSRMRQKSYPFLKAIYGERRSMRSLNNKPTLLYGRCTENILISSKTITLLYGNLTVVSRPQIGKRTLLCAICTVYTYPFLRWMPTSTLFYGKSTRVCRLQEW